MKVKFIPVEFNPCTFADLVPDVIVNPETVVRKVSADTISIDGYEWTLPSQYSTFTNIADQTAIKNTKEKTVFPRIIGAYYSDGEPYITLPRFWINKCGPWDTGDYQILEDTLQGSLRTPIVCKGETAAEIDSANYSAKCTEIKNEQYARCQAIQWRIDRYRDQVDNGEATNDSETQYKTLLEYKKELRAVDKQEGFPDTIVWPELPA